MSDYVVITGVSSGIGKAYTKAGNNLILVAQSEDKLNEIAL